MTRLLDREGCRRVERCAIDEIGLPEAVLIENAAVAAAELIGRRWPNVTVLVLAGPGNNGADGLALVRQLAARGSDVRALVFAGGRELSGEAERQRQSCRSLGLDVREADDSRRPEEDLAGRELIVDALFGIGLSRPLSGRFARWAEVLAARGARVLAIDIPSGLDADSSEIPGAVVRAQATITFFAPKPALLLAPASGVVGDLFVHRLTLPEDRIEAHGLPLRLVGRGAFPLPARERDTHKGSFGHVLLWAGSPGKAGAAILAARAVLRSGAGLVTIAAHETLVPSLAEGCPEAMTLPLAEGSSPGELAASVLDFSERVGALAIGPGLGLLPATAEAVREVASAAAVPLVVDADALAALEGDASVLRDRVAPTVLTPHPGEMANLLGLPSPPRGGDARLASVRRASLDNGAIVVLKGWRSLIAEGEQVWINPTGNPGMATAGSGDVLTGCLAALLAAGVDPLRSTLRAVWCHGLAGDLAREMWGEIGLMAGDLLDELPRALARPFGEPVRARAGGLLLRDGAGR